MTRRGIAFTPKPTRIAEAFIKSLFVQKYPGHVPVEGPLELTVLVYLPIPKSASRRVHEDMATGKIRPTKRPDLDNVLKLVMDSLNGLAYKDDSQIVDEDGEKWYSRTPHVEVKISFPGEES